MDQALEALKRRYNVGSFILAGQSGGGQIVAALLNRRGDIAAAVMASSLLSVRQAAAHWAYRRDIPARFLYDADRFYDPLENIERIPKVSPPTIYVISDPEDRTVPFSTQLRYVRRLRSAGFEPQHIFAHAPPPSHHVLTGHARLAAALIAKEATARSVRARLGELDWRNVRKQGETPRPRPFERRPRPEIEAQSAICLTVAQKAGQEPTLLFDKYSSQRQPPASLTKLMTAVVMLDLMKKSGRTLADHLAIEETDTVGGSGLNLTAGEKISFRDAIVNLMLPSSNITANAVARTFGQLLLDEASPSRNDARERFIVEMNVRAKRLGMRHTLFKNPSGQSAHGQLTTAADMAKLMLAAIECPEILDSWGKSTHVMRVLGPKPREQQVHSTVKVIDDYDVMGGKTGTLLPGCYNVAILSEAPNGGHIVSVILHAPDPMALYGDLRCLLDAVKRGRDWSAGC